MDLIILKESLEKLYNYYLEIQDKIDKNLLMEDK